MTRPSSGRSATINLLDGSPVIGYDEPSALEGARMTIIMSDWVFAAKDGNIYN
jgi:hypothetical protein